MSDNGCTNSTSDRRRTKGKDKRAERAKKSRQGSIANNSNDNGEGSSSSASFSSAAASEVQAPMHLFGRLPASPMHVHCVMHIHNLYPHIAQWGLAICDATYTDWFIFQARQHLPYGPFSREHHYTPPGREHGGGTFIPPLIALGEMDLSWWNILMEIIERYPVRRLRGWEGSQRFVVELWTHMFVQGIVSDEVHHKGRVRMMPFYRGQEFPMRPARLLSSEFEVEMGEWEKEDDGDDDDDDVNDAEGSGHDEDYDGLGEEGESNYVYSSSSTSTSGDSGYE